MTQTAFIFPGQGGQFIGQGADWSARDPEIKAYFDLADQVSHRAISRFCFEGPLEELNRTENLQLAVLAVDLAAARILKLAGEVPDFAAGHSLGEYGALVLAEVITPEAAFELVAKRSELMAQAAEGGGGAMAAVLNLTAEEVEGLCELARHEGQIVAANFNSPQQTVISGEARAVAACLRFVEKKGGKSVTLPVSGAFHSPLMKKPARLFQSILEPVEFKKPAFPIVPNASGELTSDPSVIKKHLQAQMTSPVLWTKTIACLNQAGAESYLECWPKNYIGPMIRRTLGPSVKAQIRSAGK
jgi:[acyl-carrier-protein] S-malonyltransferase